MSTTTTTEQCDECTAPATTEEFMDMPDRYDYAEVVRWHTGTKCKAHASNAFTVKTRRAELQAQIDAMTDTEYLEATYNEYNSNES